MKRALIVAFFMGLLITTEAYAIGGNADHRNKVDILEDDDIQIEGSDTRYTPDVAAFPAGVVIDEVYLRLEFSSGVTPTVDHLLALQCGTYNAPLNGVRKRIVGRDLIVSYGFVDFDLDGDGNSDEKFFNAPCTWNFLIAGENPLISADVVVTFHLPGVENMPDLYMEGDIGGETFPGENKLFVLTDIPPDMDNEEPLSSVGSLIDDKAEKIVVLIHGWNPKGYTSYDPDREGNHYWPPPGEDGALYRKWVELHENLIGNPAVIDQGWTVSLYDWYKDASTGPIIKLVPPSMDPENPHRARDAALAHGLKLGRLLVEGSGRQRNLKNVHFIAHSAGNWVAKRAAEYLRLKFGGDIKLQITSLDPFVNDDEIASIDELDLQPNFELMREWVNFLDNYYVFDDSINPFNFGTDLLGWTSGDFLGWDRNVYLENLTPTELYEEFMDDHAGPVFWYAQTATAALTIAATFSPDPVRPSEQLHQVVTVRNEGVEDVNNVVASAAVPSHTRSGEGISAGGGCPGPYCEAGEVAEWPLGTLKAGETRTVQLVSEVNSGSVAPPDGTQIRNVAHVRYHGWGAFDQQDVLVDSTPMRLWMAVDREPVGAGEQLGYTLGYYNASGEAATDTLLRVPLPAGSSLISASAGVCPDDSCEPGEVDWNLGTLAAGAGGQQQVRVQLDESARAGLLTSDAVLQDIEGAAARTATVVDAGAALSLSLTATPNPVRPGEQVHQVVTVRNQSAAAVSDVVASVAVPSHTRSGASASAGGACPGPYCEAGEVAEWMLGTIEAGETRTVQLVSVVNSGSVAPPDGTLLVASASVSSSTGSGGAVQAILVDATPMRLWMAVDREPIGAGEQLGYTLGYYNASGVAATETLLRVPLPAGSSQISASAGGVARDGAMEWNLGTLAAGAGGQHQVRVQLDGSAAAATALLMSDAVLQNSEGVGARTATVVDAGAALSLSLTATPNPVRPGEQVHQVVTVRNQSAAAVSDVVASVAVPSHTRSGASASAGGACPGPYCEAGEVAEWMLGTIEAGETRTVQLVSVVNSGSVAPPDGTLLVASASVSSSTGSGGAVQAILVDATPMRLWMAVDREPIGAGEQLGYTLGYYNASGVAATETLLRVPLPAGSSQISASAGGVARDGAMEWNLGTLAAGAGGQHQVRVQLDGSAAAATALLMSDAVLQNSEGVGARTATVVDAGAALSLSLTATPNPVRPGEQVHQVVTVRNQSAAAVSDVVASVAVPSHTRSGASASAGGACPGPYCEAGEVAEWMLGTIEAGETRTVQLVSVVNSGSAAPPDGTLLVASASFSSSTGSGGAVQAILVDATPMRLWMAVDREPVGAGEQLGYTLGYYNASGEAATDTLLRVPLPAGSSQISASAGGVARDGAMEWNLGTLAAGAGGQHQVRVQLDGSAAAATGLLMSDAVLQNSEGVGARTATVVDAGAALSLSLTATPNPVRPGEQVHQVVTVRNQSAAAVSDVVVSVAVPSHTRSGASASAGGACPGPYCEAGEVAEWMLGTIEAGETRTVQLVSVVNSGSAAPPDGTLLVASASVSSSTGSGGAVQAILVDATPMRLWMAVDREPLGAGEQLGYTLGYYNASEVAATETLLRVPLPAGSTRISASAGACSVESCEPGEVEWNLGTLAAGASGQQQIRVQLDGSAATGLLMSDAVLQNSEGAAARTATVVDAGAALALSLTATPNPVRPGEQVHQVVTVRNESAAAVDDVVVSVAVPSYTRLGSSPSAGGVCPGPYCEAGEVAEWTLGTIEAGETRTVQLVSVVNSGSAAPPDGTLLVASASVSSSTGSGGAVQAVLVDSNALGCPAGLVDTDNDGVFDCDEVRSYGTDPGLFDTDGDGIGDGTEVGVAGFDADPLTTTDPLNPDSDGDGYFDGNNGSDPCEDCDNNGRVDFGETDPAAPDAFIRLVPGLNLFSYPGDVPPERNTCAELAEALGGTGLIESIERLNPATGLLEECDVGAGVGFPVVTGEGYVVQAQAEVAMVWPWSPVCPARDLEPGLNLVGYPAPMDLTCVSWLAAQVPGTVSSIQGFDPDTGRFETCVLFSQDGGEPHAVGVDFPIRAAQGYLFNATDSAPVVYPGCP